MNLTDLKPADIGHLIVVRKGDGPDNPTRTGAVLVGVLNSYELQWADGKPHYVWLLLAGREHKLDATAAAQATIHVENRP